jgi:glycosyltransferase involved in cell wall biosynthesis
MVKNKIPHGKLKIAYVAEINTDEESGVLKKIAGQIRSWLQEGHEATLFALSPRSHIWPGIEDIPCQVIVSPNFQRSFFRSSGLVELVLRWRPDIAYFRFGLYTPSYEKLCFSIPTVVEINSYDFGEYRQSRRAWFLLPYHALTRDRVLKKVRGMVFVTHELADRFGTYRQLKKVISNGIDFTQCFRWPPAVNSHPRLVVMVSRGSSWHGLDKVIWLASKLSHWKFDLIGEVDIGSDIPSNLIVHGRLPHDQYNNILASVDIAIGTLALHRKEMDEACPLKVREYLACGIPTIIGYRDTDFPQSVPFLLQLPNMPDNVQMHVNEISAFVESWRGRRVSHQDIIRLDSNIKELERLAFFGQVLEHRVIS